MSARRFGAATAGLALGSMLIGALSSLTAIPPAAMLACLFLLARGLDRSTIAPFVAGLIAGLSLPNAPPGASGDIVTRGPGGHEAGDLFEALDRIDRDPQAMLGRTLTVSGNWRPASDRKSASVARSVMTCCAADAIAVGFDVLPARRVDSLDGAFVRATGRLVATLRDGEIRYALEGARVQPRSPANPTVAEDEHR